MKIKREVVNEILDLMFNTFAIGVDGDADFHPRYSGRGMNGAECVGFVIKKHEAAAFGATLALAFEDDTSMLLQLLAGIRSDDLGTDTIVYFPGVELED